MRETDESIHISLGRAVADAREHAGLTAVGLAAAAGCSDAIVRRIEAGHLPSVRTLLALCEALDVRASDLLREAGA